MNTNPDLTYIEHILENYTHKSGALIPVLQKVQDHYTYIPESAVDLIAGTLNIPSSEIYGVITFYAQFYTQPQGKYTIRLCRGTACHVKLGVREGETTSDRLYTLRIVACLGACAVAPVMMINDDYYGELTAEKVDKIFTGIGQREPDLSSKN
jgi:NADH-quinone oxidoreductase subunit E